MALLTHLHTHRAQLVIAGLVSLIMMATYSAGPQVSMILLVIGVCAIGLPHGALDYLELREMAGGSTYRLALHAGAYLLLAAAITLGWLIAPAPVFAVLLAIAWLHFGLSDSEATDRTAFRMPEAVIRGGMIIFGPLLYWRETLASYFAHMSRQPAQTVINWLETWLVPLLPGFWLAAACCMALFALTPRMRATALEMAIIAGVMICLPPLAAFATYFTLWHSWGHMRREVPVLLDRGMTPGHLIVATGLVTAVTLVIFAPLLLLGESGLFARILPALFIMLLALTPPHMLLHMRSGTS